ncbi:hypothetical protein C9374_008002 [Naegleria lovaniensis]|uniref:Ubiquitin-like domain-containing protein n=1 Tax=Naegleria lovaniensis TaxID=51637 RepID=A0AA88KLF9_NAELO|nr:uncharacterized protein C9374_008002 [Naegleria lovaniensis]KAG2378854.1 hypothetical protein C9374_008002 [Naegleria lovaniensis]
MLHLSSLVSSENSNATVTTTTLENVSPPMITITNIANNKSIKVPLCVSDCTISDLKKQLLNNHEYMEGLFCKSNFPLKFVEDVMLIRNGKELKDTTCWYDPSETSFNVFLLTKKPQYFVKLMMEGGRTIIVDSEAITFESTVAEFKKFVEKRMRVNMSEVNEQRQLVLLRNQQKILDESQSIGMVFPSQSTLSLVFL